MSDKAPAMFFYVKDWLSAADVMACSDAAQGVWFRMLCYLQMSDDKTLPGTIIALANILGRSPEYLTPIISELELNRVFSREPSGRIFNRRLANDLAKASKLYQARSKAGSKGGTKKAANLKALAVCNEVAAKQNIAKASLPSPSPSPVRTSKVRTQLEGTGGSGGETAPSARTPSPLFRNCKFLRMDDREEALARTWYRDRGLTRDFFELVVLEVDRWLGTTSAKAVKARAAPSHKDHLYASWAIDNANKICRVSNSQNGSQQQRQLSVTEHNEQFFKEEFAKLAEAENGHSSRSDEVVEISGHVVPDDEVDPGRD